jgi:hypothetical protein
MLDAGKWIHLFVCVLRLNDKEDCKMAKEATADLRGRGIEEQLMHLLRYGGLEKQNLAELIKIIASFAQHGVRPIKVFPIGIPAPDGVGFHVLLPHSELLDLLKYIIETDRIHGIEIFPKGIPRPDVFLTEVRLR